MIDVHCHLTSEAFATDLDAVLARAAAAGVRGMIAVGETPDDNRRVLALARQHPNIYAALGHYPEHTDETWADETEALLRAHAGEVAAVGEIGIDHWLAQEAAAREPQHALFTRFVRLAGELDLPLSVHSRSAGHHAIRLLQELGATRVCLHAFDGKAKYALAAAEAGYFLSVPPSIVRSTQKRKMVAAVPLEQLLLETDAPVLGPDREARNEPANLTISVAAIAEIKSIDEAQVREVCADNTERLFRLRARFGERA